MHNLHLQILRIKKTFYLLKRALFRIANILLKILVGSCRKAGKMLFLLFHLILPKFFWGYLRSHKSFFLRRNQARRYLNPNLSISDFFEILREKHVNYVVLRWFEELPNIQENEDIDILVADQHVTLIEDLFVRKAGTQKFDIYSESGLLGTDYNGKPYFPSRLAKQILGSRWLMNQMFSVPSYEIYFLSLAFHAIFHKGKLSGLPNSGYSHHNLESEHDYHQILQSVAEKAGISKDFHDLQDYFEFLKERNWIPENDTLRLLASQDSWYKSLLKKNNSTDFPEQGELIVFVLRDDVFLQNKHEFIRESLSREKIEILFEIKLNLIQKQVATERLRGGDWGCGPYFRSGGKPNTFFVCFDYHPQPLSRSDCEKYPYVRNKHVFIKHKIRDEINAFRLYFQWSNVIHSADNEEEAWEYLECVAPDLVSEVRKAILNCRKYYSKKHPVLRLFDSGRSRSKVELVQYQDSIAVKKTFKHGYENFLESEVLGYTLLPDHTEVIPPLLDKESHHIIIPFYENLLLSCSFREKKELIRPHAQEIIGIMQAFYEAGYALIGFYPGNLIVTPSKKLKIIDFEFLYKYKIKPANFLLSYDIAGVPLDFDGELPRGHIGKGHTYANTWKPLLGPLSQYI